MNHARTTTAIRYARAGDGTVEILFDPPDARLVVFSRALLAELDRVVSAVEADLAGGRPVRLVLVRSAKPDCFIAGADIEELLALPDAAAATRLNRTVHALFDRIGALPVPTVAVIDGACLGGGTECALACSYRIATDHPKTRIGLPEVTLGIIPGWGGTQRLPRLIGPAAALPLIVSGRALTGPEAAATGLVDRCVQRSRLEAAIAEVRADPPAAAAPAAERCRRSATPSPPRWKRPSAAAGCTRRRRWRPCRWCAPPPARRWLRGWRWNGRGSPSACRAARDAT